MLNIYKIGGYFNNFLVIMHLYLFHYVKITYSNDMNVFNRYVYWVEINSSELCMEIRSNRLWNSEEEVCIQHFDLKQFLCCESDF